MAGERILLIGAGASGLMAARELAKAGKRITLLEAKEKTGGRILDIQDPSMPVPIMLGAEFIHGNVSLTLSLLKEAGISYHPISGKSYSIQHGKLVPYDEYDDYWPDFIAKLKLAEGNVSLTDFLSTHFSGDKYESLRKSVNSFVEGYDAADPDKVSLLSLQQEWQKDDDDEQYRIEGGYSRLITYLEKECINAGVLILTNRVVSHFNWSEGYVEAITSGGQRFSAEKAIITLPLGVLQIKDGSLGFVNFTPPLPIRMGAVRALGYGTVIKTVLYFKNAFWNDAAKNVGFIYSREVIPIWWTQLPDNSPVLTGWLAGPEAEKHKKKSEEQIMDLALQSIANIFNQKLDEVKSKLIKGYILNWAVSPFSRGAYAFTTIEDPNAHRILGSPVENTLYFAGEATYDGPHGGTVEAALVSGRTVAEKVLDKVKS